MTEQDQATFDLRHYLRILWRRKFIIIAVVIVIPAIVLVLALNKANVYQATAAVMVESDQTALTVIAPQTVTGSVDPRTVATLAEFVTTPTVNTAVQQQLGWADTPEKLAKSITTVANTDANIIDITASQPTADKAAALTNAYATQFVAWRQQTEQAAISAALTLIDQQIAATKPGSADYVTLVSQREQLQTVKALTTGGVSVGEQAQAPSAPASPRPKKDTALALAAALVLGIGLAFLRDALDVKIHTLEDLQQLATVPIIATIGRLPREYRRNGKLVALESPRSPAAEAYRVLRTNLDFVNFNHDMRSFIVTSPLPGQGKSTTIANLAIVLIRSGKRVTVVEGDLRRPTMHSYFSVPNNVGLTSVIAGIVPLDKAIRTLTLREPLPAIKTPDGVPPVDTTVVAANGTSSATAVVGRPDAMAASDPIGTLQLRLLTSGPLPPNPGEIASSRQLSELLEKLKEDNDYVLVDAPPMLTVGDAAAIAGKVDGVMVIVRVEETTRQQMAEVARFFERVPTRALGIIASGVERTDRKAYAHYHEYY